MCLANNGHITSRGASKLDGVGCTLLKDRYSWSNDRSLSEGEDCTWMLQAICCDCNEMCGWSGQRQAIYEWSIVEPWVILQLQASAKEINEGIAKMHIKEETFAPHVWKKDSDASPSYDGCEGSFSWEITCQKLNAGHLWTRFFSKQVWNPRGIVVVGSYWLLLHFRTIKKTIKNKYKD